MGELPFGHESSGIDVRSALVVGAILAAVAIGGALAIRFAVADWIAPQHARLVARSAQIPPTPRLQHYPDSDLTALRAEKQVLLSTWAWTDGKHEFARIPIERAMALYARQHATAQGAPAAAAPGAGAGTP